MTQILNDTEFTEEISRELHIIGDALPVAVKIGITGSRNLPTDKQQFTLGILINTIARAAPGRSEIHHGMCVGTDECAHFIGASIRTMSVIGHPGYGQGKRAPYRMKAGADLFTVIYPALPYGQRNRAIVKAVGVLLACPRYPEKDSRSARSGTWQTIRMMKRAHKPAIIIPPSGVIIHSHDDHE